MLCLLRQLAAFEGEPSAVVATEEALRQDGFGAHRRFEALLFVPQSKVRGIAVLYPGYSSWQARPTLILHDLFVEEGWRGRGAGRALVKAAAQKALETGACRLDVMVLGSNGGGRRFYEELGFQRLAAWHPYRLEAPGIERLARDESESQSRAHSGRGSGERTDFLVESSDRPAGR
jgi:GNAT superfamily N-acetyltransferase